MLKTVYMRNRDIQSDRSKPVTDYAIAIAVGKVISDTKCVQRDRDLWRIYTNGQKKGYTVYMLNYSPVYLKHSIFLT